MSTGKRMFLCAECVILVSKHCQITQKIGRGFVGIYKIAALLFFRFTLDKTCAIMYTVKFVLFYPDLKGDIPK